MFSSLFRLVVLGVRGSDVLEVTTGVVMPHSIRILSGSTLSISLPVKVVVEGEVCTL